MSVIDENIQIANRKIMRKILIIFLCVMIFLTFFSKTINNFTLPKVKSEYASAGSLFKDVIGEGTVVAKEVQHEYTQLNTVVKSVNVGVGDKVIKGQVLMTLEKQETERQLKETSILVEKQKLALQKAEKEADTFASEAEDLELAAAKQKLEEKETNHKNITTLYDFGAESLSALKTAEYELEDAKRDYEKARRVYEERKLDTSREIQEAKLDLELKQLHAAKLNYELENYYIIKAKYSGIVKEMNFEEGTATNSSKPLCVVINNEKGYEFKTSVNADTAKYLAVGDSVDVRIKTLGGKIIKGIISEIKESELKRGIQKDIYIDIEEESLTGGEVGDIYISKDIGFYALLISNDAVQKDIEGNFLWVIRERRKALGNEYYLVKTYVTVGESDSSKTAILSGLTVEDGIVYSIDGNKTVTDGSRVILID